MPTFDNQPAKSSLPLLRMGQDIHKFYLCRYPAFRAEKSTKGAETNPDFIRQRISHRYSRAKAFLMADDAPDCLRPFRNPSNNRQKPERIYTLALMAFYSFSTIFSDRSEQGIERAVAVCSSTDSLAGSLAAAVAIHELLETRLLYVHENEVYMCNDLLAYISDNNPLTSSATHDLTNKERNDAARAIDNMFGGCKTPTPKPDQYFGKMSLMSPEKITDLKNMGLLDGIGNESSACVIIPIPIFLLKP